MPLNAGAEMAAVLTAIEGIIGRRPQSSDRIEADLALDSLDLARVATAVEFDLYRQLVGYDFDRLAELTVADLIPSAASPG